MPEPGVARAHYSCSKYCFSVILATTPNKQLSYLFLKQNIRGAPPPDPGATCIPRLGEPLPPNPQRHWKLATAGSESRSTDSVYSTTEKLLAEPQAWGAGPEPNHGSGGPANLRPR